MVRHLVDEHNASSTKANDIVDNMYADCPMCDGDREVDEPVCMWCDMGIYHSECDDSFYTQLPCPVCNPETGEED